MIDWNRVSELRQEVGAEDFAEVIELFFDECDTAITALKDVDDCETLENQCHFLKGSALNIGFEHLAQLCQNAEMQAAGGTYDPADIASIIAAYHAARVAFWEKADLAA